MDVLKGLGESPAFRGNFLTMENLDSVLAVRVCVWERERLQLKALMAVMAHNWGFVYRGAVLCVNRLSDQIMPAPLFKGQYHKLCIRWLVQDGPRGSNFFKHPS